LTGLEELSVAGNRLTKVPAVIAKLRGLRDLNLGQNKLPALDAKLLRSLSGLRCLSLFGNPLAALPEEIGCLSQLQELRLEGLTIRTPPESLRRLRRLRKVYLNQEHLLSVTKVIDANSASFEQVL
jgi:Leucine-rich repeat (LRR) protein